MVAPNEFFENQLDICHRKRSLRLYSLFIYPRALRRNSIYVADVILRFMQCVNNHLNTEIRVAYFFQ